MNIHEDLPYNKQASARGFARLQCYSPAPKLYLCTEICLSVVALLEIRTNQIRHLAIYNKNDLLKVHGFYVGIEHPTYSAESGVTTD